MPEPKTPASSSPAFKAVTVVVVGLLLYVGVCGARLYGVDDTYVSNGLVLTITGIFMLIVIAVWLALRAILRKDKR